MAINKERLQELINKGATIYTIKPIGGDVMELHLKNISDDFWYFLLGMTEELFEDKAEVEEKAKKIKWSFKYHATRTEELNLPMWEEAEKGIEYNIYAPKGCIYRLKTKIKTGYSCDKENPYVIRIEKVGYTNSPHDFEFNEENYIKACDLCLKLFKGEEV